MDFAFKHPCLTTQLEFDEFESPTESHSLCSTYKLPTNINSQPVTNMSGNELLLFHMDESHFLALEEEFCRMTADMIAMGDVSPLELDDEWFRILRVEEERFVTQVLEGRFGPAADNGEVSIATNCTPHTAMESPLAEQSSDFEEPEEMIIDTQEDEFDEEEGQARDFEEPDEVIIDTQEDEHDEEEGLPRDFEEHEDIIATDGDEFDDGEEFIPGSDGDECDGDVETVTDTDEDEFDDEEELPRESEELTREEEEVLFRYYEEMRETYDGEYEISDPEEGSGIRWPPRQIEHFLQTLPRMETGTLGPDDLKCAICQSEFGKERGEVEALDSGQGLPGQESAEYPVKLPCGHVFGLWCIETWLLNAQPASCPLCRYLFQPV